MRELAGGGARRAATTCRSSSRWTRRAGRVGPHARAVDGVAACSARWGALGSEDMARQDGAGAGRGAARRRHPAATSRPSMDVDTNPKNPDHRRPFVRRRPRPRGPPGRGHDPRACRTAAWPPAAKHFPGHGDTDVDSHLDAARRSSTRARASRTSSCRPFRKAIEAGVGHDHDSARAGARAGRRSCRRRCSAASSTASCAASSKYQGVVRHGRPRDEGGGRALAAGQAAALAAQAAVRHRCPCATSHDAQVSAHRRRGAGARSRGDLLVKAMDDCLHAHPPARRNGISCPVADPDPRAAARRPARERRVAWPLSASEIAASSGGEARARVSRGPRPEGKAAAVAARVARAGPGDRARPGRGGLRGGAVRPRRGPHPRGRRGVSRRDGRARPWPSMADVGVAEDCRAS